MKANFPVEYMAAILTAESGDVEKISEIIKECKNMNIPVLPPHINESYGGFTCLPKEPNGAINDKNKSSKIRFGFYTIKNLGTDIADAIIKERKEKTDKYEFLHSPHRHKETRPVDKESEWKSVYQTEEWGKHMRRPKYHVPREYVAG
jgi:DNA polymerase-3 subunit alpha